MNILHDVILKHVSASDTTVESIEIYRPSLVHFLYRCDLPNLILPAFYDSYLLKVMSSVKFKRESSHDGDIPAKMFLFLGDFLQFADHYCIRRTWYPHCHISCWQHLASAVFDSDINTTDQYIERSTPLIDRLVEAHDQFAHNQMDIIGPRLDNPPKIGSLTTSNPRSLSRVRSTDSERAFLKDVFS